MTDLLVLHDVGAAGGGKWADAFADWPGRVLAPDLPGHNGAPPPTGGNYETGDAVYVALDLLRVTPAQDRVDELVVVGVGHNGAAAQVLALGGRAAGVVLVDGLGGPWADVDAVDRHMLAVRRAVLTTPGALDWPAPGSDDPRATLVVEPMDRDFAIRQAEAMPVPTLLIETPASVTPDAEVVARHYSDATLVRIGDRDPAAIASAVRSWWAAR